MIYLVFRIISENNLAKAIRMEEGAGIVDFLFKGTINTLVYFIILIGLMIGSLIVASKMGVVGSSTMMKWGTATRKWGQGYAGGKIKRGAGFASEKMLDEKSWINQKDGGRIQGAIRGTVKTIRRAPMADRGLARASSWREQQMKAEEAKYKKQYGSYSDAGFATVSGVQDGMTAKTLKKFGMKYTRGEAIKGVEKEKKDKNKKKERKEENIKRENNEYEEIKNRQKSSSYGTKGNDELKEDLVKIEARLAGLTNISADAIKKDPSLQAEQDDIDKKRMDAFMERATINQEKEDRERKRQIEESREKRDETEEVKERVSEVESKAESSSGEKKEKPTS